MKVDRTYKNIEEVQNGYTNLTYNFMSKKFEENPDLEKINVVDVKLIKVIFNRGDEIISTEDHPYHVKGKGWCSFNPEHIIKNLGIETKHLETSD